MSTSSMQQAASKFIEFVNASPSHFHAVASARRRLLQSGFKELSEAQPWNLARGGKYFYTRNQSSLVAFGVGGKFEAGNGLTIVAAHTDSPNFKVKPVSKNESQGYAEVGVECYGGGLWHTWFDRDLTVAGRVLVRQGNGVKSTLVHVKRPIMRIPTLAIHLDRGVNEKLELNKETHLVPVLATSIKAQLQTEVSSAAGGKHHATLLHVVARELECNVEDIENFELSVCDSQPATIGGALEEFIFSPRLDNLMCSFLALESLCEAKNLDADRQVRAILLFDNEEVGSNSAHGAAAPMLRELVDRVTANEGLGGSGVAAVNAAQSATRKSFLVSADMAHAVHPNYASKHETKHRPAMHGGVVIKHNANQRYATTALSAFVLLELAKRNNIPIQEFVVRNDSPCGSTIGPILSANTGIRTVDVGNPQLSMHSIREMCGTDDVEHGIRLFTALFEQFADLDAEIDAGDAGANVAAAATATASSGTKAAAAKSASKSGASGAAGITGKIGGRY